MRLEVAFGLGDRGVGGEPRRLPLLIGLGFLDAGVAFGLGLADGRVPLDLRGSSYTESLEVALLILDVADREADDFQPHVGHVGGGHVTHLLGKGHTVAVNVLDGHRAENGALLPLEGLQGDLRDLPHGLAQELLRRGAYRILAASDFDLRNAVHRNRDALLGVDPGRVDWKGHNFQG